MKNNVIISKMIIHIDKILNYTYDMDYDMFMRNSMVVEACVFNLSQIGELANCVHNEIVEKNKQIPWKQVYGLRNRIVHDYDGVNLKLVWEIINEDLSDLKLELEKLDIQ